jgi:hypothetical protein
MSTNFFFVDPLVATLTEVDLELWSLPLLLVTVGEDLPLVNDLEKGDLVLISISGCKGCNLYGGGDGLRISSSSVGTVNKLSLTG